MAPHGEEKRHTVGKDALDLYSRNLSAKAGGQQAEAAECADSASRATRAHSGQVLPASLEPAAGQTPVVTTAGSPRQLAENNTAMPLHAEHGEVAAATALSEDKGSEQTEGNSNYANEKESESEGDDSKDEDNGLDDHLGVCRLGHRLTQAGGLHPRKQAGDGAGNLEEKGIFSEGFLDYLPYYSDKVDMPQSTMFVQNFEMANIMKFDNKYFDENFEAEDIFSNKEAPDSEAQNLGEEPGGGEFRAPESEAHNLGEEPEFESSKNFEGNDEAELSNEDLVGILAEIYANTPFDKHHLECFLDEYGEWNLDTLATFQRDLEMEKSLKVQSEDSSSGSPPTRVGGN